MNKKIYNILKKNDIKIDEDLFYYGWANFTHYFVYLIFTFILAFYCNCFKQTIIFLLLYIPLRRYIGGFHFSSNIICIFFSTLISIIPPLLSKQLFVSFRLVILTSLILLIETFLIAPVDHKNKRLTNNQINLYKKKSIIIEFLYIGFIIISYKYSIHILINIIFSVIVMIFHLGVGTLIMPLISLALFAGITAYDMQKSLQLYNYATSNPEMLEKLSIYGAFNLYLDFVNIFLDILQLLGDNK